MLGQPPGWWCPPRSAVSPCRDPTAGWHQGGGGSIGRVSAGSCPSICGRTPLPRWHPPLRSCRSGVPPALMGAGCAWLGRRKGAAAEMVHPLWLGPATSPLSAPACGCECSWGLPTADDRRGDSPPAALATRCRAQAALASPRPHRDLLMAGAAMQDTGVRSSVAVGTYTMLATRARPDPLAGSGGSQGSASCRGLGPPVPGCLCLGPLSSCCSCGARAGNRNPGGRLCKEEGPARLGGHGSGGPPSCRNSTLLQKSPRAEFLTGVIHPPLEAMTLPLQ